MNTVKVTFPPFPFLVLSLILGAAFVLGMRELSLQYQRSIDAQWNYSQLMSRQSLKSQLIPQSASPGRE